MIDKIAAQMGYDSPDDEEFISTMEDVARHGAEGGFPGFTYYKDTIKFYAENRDEIVRRLEALAEELGEDVIMMVRTFNCLSSPPTTFGKPRVPHYTSSDVGRVLYVTEKDEDVYTQIANALAWFALEDVAREKCSYV